jgi:hypothetical protein
MHEQNLYGVLSSVVHFAVVETWDIVGMSSTMFSVRRLCMPGPVSNRMSFYSIYLSMSILPRPCLSRFDIIRCIYTTSASFMSCLFEGVSTVPHLRIVPTLPGWRGYVQKLLCWSRGIDEQVSTGPRSPEYIIIFMMTVDRCEVWG